MPKVNQGSVVKAVTQALKEYIDTSEYQDILAKSIFNVIPESKAPKGLQVIVDYRVTIVNPETKAIRVFTDLADIIISLDRQ